MKEVFRKILICVSAVLLNLLTAYIFTDFLGVPLFFDTIFTVAVTFYLGLVPGLVTAVLYNVMDSPTQPFRGYDFHLITMAFAICGAAIALVTWVFSRRKEEFKISTTTTILYLTLISLLSAFASTILGGIIDAIKILHFDLSGMYAPIYRFEKSFLMQKMNIFSACILAQIPISFSDRVITTFAGYGVFLLMEKMEHFSWSRQKK